MLRISRLVVLDQRVGAPDRRHQIFGVAGHFIQAQVGVAVFSDDVGLNVILSVLAPAAIIGRAGIGGGIGHAGPGIACGSGAVFKFVVDEVFEKSQRARVTGVGIE